MADKGCAELTVMVRDPARIPSTNPTCMEDKSTGGVKPACCQADAGATTTDNDWMSSGVRLCTGTWTRKGWPVDDNRRECPKLIA